MNSSKSNSSVCPFVSSSQAAMEINSTQSVSQVGLTSNAPSIVSGVALTEQDIRFKQAQNTTSFYSSLREECQAIENHMKEAELEVLRKEEDAFLSIRFEYELSRLQTLQAQEIREKKVAFEKYLAARGKRQTAKKAQKQLFRDIKKRDTTITEQEVAAKATQKIQEQLSDRSKGFEQQIAFVETKHEKQRKQLIAAQERKLIAEKNLHDLETKHLKTELRSTLAKNFHAKINHQKALDKRMMDHQRELQLLELRHLKERADLEEKSFEEIQSLKIAQNTRILETQAQHVSEMHSEKDRMYEVRQNVKIGALELKHTSELKQLTQSHRAQVRQMKMQHQQMMKQRKLAGTKDRIIDSLLERSLETTPASQSVTQNQPRINVSQMQPLPQRGRSSGNARNSGAVSRTASQESVSQYGDDNDDRMMDIDGYQSNVRLSTGVSPRARNQQFTLQEDHDDEPQISPEIAALQESLRRLAARQKEDINQLVRSQREESDRLSMLWQTKLKELEIEQAAEMEQVKDTQEREISEMITSQEREIQMEAAVHDTEMKMLVERRLLSSVLNTVVDGIITIDPVGTIKRFNAAAEKLFGYAAAEVIETNIRDLMPKEYSINHDTYLRNYMTTGIKKVIGKGRRAYGLRKDGSVFPLHLSISEVKDEGIHLFTGIVRDMTSEVENEKQQIAAEQQKQDELKKLVQELDESKAKAETLLSNMLPATISRDLLEGRVAEPTSYESCTIMFSDVVGFSNLCAGISPLETVEFLNDLYMTFDDIIAQYDAYKVESVGDSYMVVSGLPNRNGYAHAGIIATLALHLLSVVSKFKMKHNPEASVQLRIGINTGPVVAGVVGLKMPRYCLFGDTVNVTSRMESSGGAMGIQVSEATHDCLQRIGGFHLKLRGETEVKGKGKMQTYWLTYKDNLPFDLPTLRSE